MLTKKRFDAERVVQTIREICTVSEFVDSDTPAVSNSSEIKQYLARGKRRLTFLSKQFEHIGYKAITSEFLYQGLRATNALFTRRQISNEGVLFVAHHDYRAGLGAEDNGTGLAMMLELGRCLSETSHTIFASFDLEELGLLGSRHFVNNLSKKELRKFLGVVALECLGSGKDAVICRAVDGAKSDLTLVSKLKHAAMKLDHPIRQESFGWFNSDHVPFAERGIRTVEVCSFNSKNYKGDSSPNVNVAHSNLDVPKNIRPSTLQVIGEILLQFANNF